MTHELVGIELKFCSLTVKSGFKNVILEIFLKSEGSSVWMCIEIAKSKKLLLVGCKNN